MPVSLPFRSLCAIVLTTLIAALLAPAGAHAGTYTVVTCDSAGINRAFTAFGDTSMIAADASCAADRFLGMKVRNSLRGTDGPVSAGPYTVGGLQAVAAPGTTIAGVHADATAYDEVGSSGIPGWRAGLMINGTTYVWCGVAFACAWAGPPALRIDFPVSAASVQLGVICGLGTGCLRDRVRAAATLKNVVLDIRDDVAPTLDVLRGTLWGGGHWVSGSASVGFDSNDGAGVRRLALDAGGLNVATTDQACDPYAMTPCPNGRLDATLDTARLPDGGNVVVARAIDAGGNVTERRSTVLIDNTAPTVTTPELKGGSGWRSENRFDLAVSATDGAGSGVQRLAWEVCRPDGGGCVSSSASVVESVAAVVPGPGEWRVRVWASDALRSGSKSGWSETLRFDPSHPGRAVVKTSGVWTNADTSNPVVAMLPDTEPRGPSGVAGYAVTIGAATPGTTVTHAGEQAVIDLGDLPEGTTPVRARAISGAGVASNDVGETLVRIDRTAPEVQLAAGDVPLSPREGEWLKRDVRLSAHGIDQTGLSGMAPAAADEPLTHGAYIEYQVDELAPVRARGSMAEVDIGEDGTHTVTVRAVDVAGNASAPQRATFRVDRTAPRGVIEPVNVLRLQHLRARVDEECIDGASLELRRQGQPKWTSVVAQAENHAVSADVPDDRLPAGDYDVRFRVRDCASNAGVIDRFAASAAKVRLPLRETLVLDAALNVAGRQAAKASATVRLGRRVGVRGRLATLEGRPVAGRRVEFQERVGPGDWRIRAAAVTDDAGRVAATLRPGPSRRLRLVVASSDSAIGATSRTLRVAVPAEATIHVSRTALRNGETVRFSGRLLGGHVPRSGRELELQGFNPLKGRWQPVRTQGLRSDRHGRWHAAYRFTATVGVTVTYRFRLRVPPRSDHPFAEGHSRVVSVTVRG